MTNKILQSDFAVFIGEWYDLPIFRSLHRDQKKLLRLKEKRRNNYPRSVAYALGKAGLAKQQNFWPRLSEMTMPVLLIVGERGRKYRSFGVEMARQMPNCKNVIVPGTGHKVALEQSKKFCRRLDEFLRHNNGAG